MASQVVDAINAIRKAGGSLRTEGEKILIRLPANHNLHHLIDTIRSAKGEALEIVKQSEDRVHWEACELLIMSGVRIVPLRYGPVVAVWKNLDTDHLRDALAMLGMADLPVWYREVPGLPPMYRTVELSWLKEEDTTMPET